jgi:hypothetical protein
MNHSKFVLGAGANKTLSDWRQPGRRDKLIKHTVRVIASASFLFCYISVFLFVIVRILICEIITEASGLEFDGY